MILVKLGVQVQSGQLQLPDEQNDISCRGFHHHHQKPHHAPPSAMIMHYHHHPLLCTIIIIHHYALSSSSTIMHYHHNPALCTIIIIHYYALSSSYIIMHYHHHPLSSQLFSVCTWRLKHQVDPGLQDKLQQARRARHSLHGNRSQHNYFFKYLRIFKLAPKMGLNG